MRASKAAPQHGQKRSTRAHALAHCVQALMCIHLFHADTAGKCAKMPLGQDIAVNHTRTAQLWHSPPHCCNALFARSHETREAAANCGGKACGECATKGPQHAPKGQHHGAAQLLGSHVDRHVVLHKATQARRAEL